MQEVKDHRDEVLHVCVSHSGHLAATCSSDRTVRIWTISEQFELQLMKVVNAEGMRSYFSPDDSFLAVCRVWAFLYNLHVVIGIYDITADHFTDSLDMHSFPTWINNSDIIFAVDESCERGRHALLF